MDSVEASGKSVDDAIVHALARLGRRRDEVEVSVLQEPSRGVRGVGAREARVRVWVKRQRAPQSGAVLTPDMADQWLGGMEEPVPAPPPVQRVPSAFRDTLGPIPTPPPVVAEEEDIDAGATSATMDLSAVESGDDEGGAAGAAPDAVVRQAMDILRTMVHHMQLPVTVELASRDPLMLNLNSSGDQELASLFIGRRGETLASLQLLVNLMLNHRKREKERFRVMVDIDHYRAHRDENLRSLAVRVAQQVIQSQHSIMLEPMTPYERRIVHMALQEMPDVQTQSTGEGEQRRVVISQRRMG